MTCIPTTHLTPPAISPLHIKDTITCIRAHRERLFRVDTEWINGKLICHNYGQGGAGWTFLFGCVHESLRLFLEQAARTITLKHQPICVIGAGCYGLLTAIMLARAGYRVRIVAKECDNLPSHNAAGFFFPRARKSSTEHERAIFQARGLESYAAYLQIINDQHPFIAQGAHLLPAYYGLDIDPGFAPYIAQGLMTPPQQTTITFGTSTSYGAMKYQTLFMNATALMAELHRNIVELGITIASAEVQEFSEIPEPIIFNCAGLGAKKLAHDTRVIPVQGHLITLKNQPLMEQLRYMLNFKVVMTDRNGRQRDELIYYAPKGDGILGITFIRGQDSLTANTHEFDRLIQRCQDFFGTPALSQESISTTLSSVARL